MPAKKIGGVLHELQSRTNSALQFVALAKELRDKQTNHRLSPPHVEMIAEFAFFRIFLAWEDFLEESFIRYLSGWASISGNKPTVLLLQPKIEMARQTIYGSKPFVDWVDPIKITSRANNYFHLGEPYIPAINAILVELQEMRTIRNRIAHRSPDANTRFKNLVRASLGYNKKGVGPGRLLLTPINPPTTATYIDNYGSIILGAANTIAL